MKIIDTFSMIPNCFIDNKFNIERWEKYCNSISPELVDKLTTDIADYDFKSDILPVLNSVPKNLDKLNVAHQSFLSLTADLSKKTQDVLQTNLDVLVVFYLGLCNGAGWATQLEGAPVVLLGAEKIIELSWYNKSDMAGLIYHELGHIWHNALRSKASGSFSDKNLWQLYREGMAMYVEQLLIDDKMFYHQDQCGWLNWCQSNKRDLFGAFLDRIINAESTRDFFGDWNAFDGISDVGYYLGCEMVKELSKKYTLIELANLEESDIYSQLNVMSK